MAETKGRRKRLPVTLSFLSLTDSTKQTHKSPNIFEGPNGVVGLGILAALNHGDPSRRFDPVSISVSRTGISSSSPIPISNNRGLFDKNGGSGSVEEMELCEEFTCVVSHVGENPVSKRGYFEAEVVVKDNGSRSVSVVNGDGDCFGSGGGFLNSCFLCEKMLHGLDIFMYRGEKAFCSAECRHGQISMDEQNEKCRSRKPVDYSVSSCSGTLQFFAGVAAA